MVAELALISAAVRSSLAADGTLSILSSPKAQRVASMLLAMYGVSAELSRWETPGIVG